jgi:non-specific serine/threonine protein kinase
MKIDAVISKYIDENASFVVITRATYYVPEFIEQKGNVLYYICHGSRKKPYDVTIRFESDINIKTSCSCPYDGYGICKHQVAALEELRDIDLEENLIDLDLLFPKPQQPKKAPLILKHKNGEIDPFALGKIKFSRSEYSFGEIKIKSLSKNQVTSVFESYAGNYKQVLKNDQKRDEISLSCSCHQSKNCFHKYLFLQQFRDLFRLDYFHKDYENRIQDNILEENNLKGKISFNEVFELHISAEGITYSEKIENIVSTPQLLFSPLEDAELKSLHKPNITNDKVKFGLGFCFQFMDYNLYKIFPFFGKLNKEGTSISSQTKEIYEQNLYHAMQVIQPEEISPLSQAINITSAFDELLRLPFDYNTIAELNINLQKFYRDFNTTFYKHDQRDNFAKKYLIEIKIVHENIQPILEVKENGKFYQLEFKVEIKGKVYLLNSTQLQINICGIFMGNELIPIKNPEVLIAFLKLKNNPVLNVYNHGIEYLKSDIIEPYSKIFDVSYKGLKEKTVNKKELKPIKQVYLSDADEGEYVVFQPIVKYNEKLVTPMSTEKIWVDDTKLMSLKRDYVLEDELLLTLQQLHPEFEEKTDYFYINTEKALESLWLMDAIEKLRAEDIQVFGLKELKGIKYNLHKPSFTTRLSSGTDWFDMEVDIEFGDQKVDLRKLQKAIIKNSNYVELSDGTLGIIPEQWIEKYKKYFKLGQTKKGHIEISNYNFNIIDELYEDLDHSPDFLKDLHARRERILHLKDLQSVKPSKHLKAKLRPYQKEGLNWMVFLHENQLGGCLADDMGLGKTLQSIAFLQHLKDQKPLNENSPSLVVAPTSLIFNWINEFEKFAPQLDTLTFTGTQRDALKDEFSKFDVILTTYGSLIKDIEFHKTQTYNYVILDESQAIKNPNSQRFKAVRLLKAYNRLALTGTPIENNTFDLYSQFNFLNPGIFGSVKHFRSTFSDAIDKEQDEYTSELLSKIIKPFILRRTKAQVAKELPNKTESVIYCEMGKKQRKVYDDFKSYFREKLKEQIENEGINRSQVYILQGLTKLRQICNSTALADKDKDYGNHSAKLDELTRHLTEKVNNHKVLVFSQFVGMLDLVKSRLDEENIIYEYLDGKTKDRESKVNRFQNDDEVRVFLISLKAGGTGLNLTKAEYVYLIDPWWNPAVENQAIDRCYRIGQNNHVFAYRMICKDTIEERIVELQDKKKTVASEVIRTDIEKKSFDHEDLVQFFGN